MPTIKEVINNEKFRAASRETQEQFLEKHFPSFAKATPEVRKQFLDKHAATSKEGGLFGSVGEAILKPIGAFFQRTGTTARVLGEFGNPLGQDVITGSRSPLAREEPPTQEEAEALAGTGLDIATTLIPAGKLAAGAGKLLPSALGKGLAGASFPKRELARKSLRSGLTALKASPLFTSPEAAGKPVERVKDVAGQVAFGAALPPVAKLAGAGIGRVSGPAKSVATKISEELSKRSPEFLVNIASGGAQRSARRLGKEITRKALAGKSLNEVGVAAGEQAEQVQAFLKNVLTKLDLAERLTLEDLGAISFRGTFRAANREAFAKQLTSKEGGDISKALVRQLQVEAGEIMGTFEAITEKLIAEGGKDVAKIAAGFTSRLKLFSKEFRRARSEAGRTLQALNKQPFRDLVQTMESIKGIKAQQATTTLWQRFKEGDVGLRDFVRLWTVNIFPLGSPVRDFFTNAGVVGSKSVESLALDAFDFVAKGNANMNRSISLMKAIGNGVGRKRLPQQIGQQLEETALGEKFINTIFFGPKIDKVLFLPAKAKSKVDMVFKRIGVWSVLEEEATKATRGLSGTSKSRARLDFFKSLTDDTIEAAVDRARKFGFNRNLSKFEEEFAANPAVRLLVTPFPRWNFQFTRFLAEHSGFDPQFWGKVKRGVVKSEDMVEFASKTLTGAGALYFADQILYDNMDFINGDYVREAGARLKMRGLDPLPALGAAVALLRGDNANFVEAMKSSSFVLSPLIDQQGGILGSFVEAVANVKNPNIAMQELVKGMNNLIPGRGVMRALEKIIDPTPRRGLGAETPFVSALSEERLDPTTGKPIEPRVSLSGAGEFGGRAAAFLQEIPLIPQVQTELAQKLLALGFGTGRPRRSTAVTIGEEEDIQGLDRQNFERIRGALMDKRLGKFFESPGIKREFARFQKSKSPELREKLRKKVQVQISKITQRATEIQLEAAGISRKELRKRELERKARRRPQTR